MTNCVMLWSGPCGLYRFAAVKDTTIPFYLETLNQNPDTSGMLMGSLLLAEDRVLSYAAVLNSSNPEGSQTALIPEAIFYFEAETDSEKLLAQRRRWINGAVAGYVWLIQNWSLISESKLPFLQNFFLIALIMSQLLMNIVIVLSPSFLALGLNFSLQSSAFGEIPLAYRILILIFYIGTYVFFVASHARIKEGEKKIIRPVVQFVIIVNMSLSLWLCTWLILDYLIHFKWELAQIIMISYISLPFILAFINSPVSCFHMIRTVIPFILLLPIMTAYFGAYSFSRLHDLTWGSRPSDAMLSLANVDHKDQKDQKEGPKDGPEQKHEVRIDIPPPPDVSSIKKNMETKCKRNKSTLFDGLILMLIAFVCVLGSPLDMRIDCHVEFIHDSFCDALPRKFRKWDVGVGFFYVWICIFSNGF
jgi:cellulose synthase/poly-beta-1,6-N-acetylglucosamine synthase-like glycosyltransferase